MIGVFDSGLGGLTVLRALAERLPEERFLYLGDNAYAPYGKRPADEIYMLTRRGVDRLFREGCGLVVIACNTAAAVALRRLQQEWLPTAWPDRNILGVFVPAIENLTGQPWMVPGPTRYAPGRVARSVAVFATRTTVDSNAFRLELERRAPRMSVIQQACPRLAQAIEEGWDESDLDRGIARYVGALMARAGSTPIDLVLLGCTHFPLVRHLFERHLPAGTKFVDQAALCAEGLAAYLARHPRFARAAEEAPGLEFLTSGDPVTVSERAGRFYGAAAAFRHIATPASPGAESAEASDTAETRETAEAPEMPEPPAAGDGRA